MLPHATQQGQHLSQQHLLNLHHRLGENPETLFEINGDTAKNSIPAQQE